MIANMKARLMAGETIHVDNKHSLLEFDIVPLPSGMYTITFDGVQVEQPSWIDDAHVDEWASQIDESNEERK